MTRRAGRSPITCGCGTRLCPQARTQAVSHLARRDQAAYCNVHATWKKLGGAAPACGPGRATAGPARTTSVIPSPSRTVLDAYASGGDGQATLAALLATYLGHVDPKATYWYLTAVTRS